jgi:hypothetical protein
MRLKLALVMLPLITSLCLAASLQKPTKTKYLLSTRAFFTMTEAGGATYDMAYDVRENLPAQVYVVVLFEDPEAPRTPLKKEFELAADAKKIQVQSTGFHMIRNDTLYNVSLLLYLDPGHTRLLARHDQKVLFKLGKDKVSKDMLDLLQKKYGLTVK